MLLAAPYRNSTYLIHVSDRGTSVLRDLELRWPVICARGNDCLVICDTTRGLLLQFVGSAGVDGGTWPLPSSMVLEYVAVVGNRCFAAGYVVPDGAAVPPDTRSLDPGRQFGRMDTANNRPCLMHLSLDAEDSVWEDCYPEELFNRKAIDGMLVDGNRLIVVDDLAIPKFLFVFEDAEREPKRAQLVALPTHGTYEEIVGATLCGSVLMVGSKTVGELGVGRYLGVIDSTCFEELGCLSIFGALYQSKNQSKKSVPHGSLSAIFKKGAFEAGGGRLIAASESDQLVILNPTQIVGDIDLADAEQTGAARQFSCILDVSELPSLSGKARPAIIEAVLGAGKYGVVLVLQMDDGSHELMLLGKRLLEALVP